MDLIWLEGILIVPEFRGDDSESQDSVRSAAVSEGSIPSRSDDQRTAEFLRLWAAHQPRLFAYILAMAPQWHDAEEILQETSVVLWRSFDQFQPGTDFRAWAAKAAFHQVLSFRKRQKRVAVPVSQTFVEAVAEQCNELGDDLDEQLRTMADCVEKLSPSERELITACYEPNAVTRDVATALGRPAGTVYKSLTRIRRMLMQCIEQTLSEGRR
jgi:RNA polymerase sigma-70 factor (ECF subfamily)